jgi:serine/threonine protein phosphatase PrpC
MRVESAGLSHVGRRKNNEDAFCAEDALGVYAVADGLGGYEGGEVASRLAIEQIVDLFRRQHADAECTWPFPYDPARTLLENQAVVAIRKANAAIAAQRHDRLAAMGSTVVLAAMAGSRVVLAHVGDSRAYLLRGGVISQRTVDHSLYEAMKAAGASNLPPLAQFPQQNVIMRALGLEHDVQVEISETECEAGDVYLLCSDGLSGVLGPEAIASHLMSTDAQTACTRLVADAFERGSQDNITAVVVRVL